jgi:hypothetical protein
MHVRNSSQYGKNKREKKEEKKETEREKIKRRNEEHSGH